MCLITDDVTIQSFNIHFAIQDTVLSSNILFTGWSRVTNRLIRFIHFINYIILQVTAHSNKMGCTSTTLPASTTALAALQHASHVLLEADILLTFTSSTEVTSLISVTSAMSTSMIMDIILPQFHAQQLQFL